MFSWLFQRITAVLLIVCLAIHLILTHIANIGQIDMDNIGARLADHGLTAVDIILLAAGVFTRWSGLFTAAMLAFFELLLAQAWLRGLPVTSCGCFGAGKSNSLTHEFMQNLVLLGLLWLALRRGRGLSADALVREP